MKRLVFIERNEPWKRFSTPPHPLHPPLPPTKEGLNNYNNSWELNLGPIQEGKGKVVWGMGGY